VAVLAFREMVQKPGPSHSRSLIGFLFFSVQGPSFQPYCRESRCAAATCISSAFLFHSIQASSSPSLRFFAAKQMRGESWSSVGGSSLSTLPQGFTSWAHNANEKFGVISSTPTEPPLLDRARWCCVALWPSVKTPRGSSRAQLASEKQEPDQLSLGSSGERSSYGRAVVEIVAPNRTCASRETGDTSVQCAARLAGMALGLSLFGAIRFRLLWWGWRFNSFKHRSVPNLLSVRALTEGY